MISYTADKQSGRIEIKCSNDAELSALMRELSRRKIFAETLDNFYDGTENIVTILAEHNRTRELSLLDAVVGDCVHKANADFEITADIPDEELKSREPRIEKRTGKFKQL